MKTLTTLVFLVLFTVGCSATGQVQADDDYFSQAELDSMLAPVALYPDSVLSHVLIAATYPLEVIQAARWTRQHPGLRGEDAVAAVEHRNWDPSVKALVAFPDLLERMDDDLDWTQRLGDAFLLQEEEVIASIQYLRSEAYSQGHLRSNDRVKIIREKEYIYIEPARTRVVYVPYYDPRVIYKRWRWSSYQPYYWHRPSGFSLSVNFHWGRPYHIRPNFYFSSFHWPTRKVVVVNPHHHYYKERRFHSGRDVAHFKEARHWKHDPKHRRGVSYRGRVEQSRFVESARHASTRTSSKSTARASVRSERRDWAAQRRSSQSFDRESSSRDRSTSRSKRVAELRDSRSDSRSASRVSRSETRTASRDRGDSSLRSRISERASSRESRSRTVTGSAPARAESRSRDASTSRSSASRAGRVSESLRSGSSSRAAANSRSRAADRASSSRLSSSRSSQAERGRSSVSVPRGLSRSSSAREPSSAPSRSRSSTRSASPSRGSSLSRDSMPSRQSAPNRSRSNDRASTSSRAAPRTRSSAPSRSSKSAPSRSSRSESTRSSRGSTSSRSRSRDSRGGGGRGDERR